MIPHKIKETISIRLDNMSTLEMVEPGSMDLMIALAKEVANYVRLVKPTDVAYTELIKSLNFHIHRYDEIVKALRAKTRDVMPELKQRDYETNVIEARKSFRDSLNDYYFGIINQYEVLP